MSGNKIDGKQLIQDSKDKTEGNKKMKLSLSQTHKAVIATVMLTILFLGSLGGMFFLGMKYEQGINDRVHNEVKSLTASIEMPKSKQ